MNTIYQDELKYHVATLSGGQDSTAMVLRMLELGLRLDHILFCDTGAEFKDMYEYIKRVDIFIQNKYNKNITYLTGDTLVDGIKKKIGIRGSAENIGRPRGIPRLVGMSFCTRDLKVNRITKFVNNLDKDVILYNGYTYNEVLRNRGDALKRLKDNYCYPHYFWHWNETQITNYLKDIDLFNPLYNHYNRTGCYMCPKQSTKSWYSLYKYYNAEFQEAKRIEKWCIDNNAVNTSFIYRLSKNTKKMEFVSLDRLEEEFIEKDKQTTIFDFIDDGQETSCLCH